MKLEGRIKQLESNMHEQNNLDFELKSCSDEPIFEVVSFLEARRLGPAGRSLYNALTGYRPLTEAQEALLVKILARMGTTGALQAIKDEMASTIQALAACDAECSCTTIHLAPLGRLVSGKIL